MRFNWPMRIAAVCGLLLGLLLNWIPASHGQAREAKPGVIWEYKTTFIRAGGDPQAPLNKLGNEFGPQGWELVTIVEHGGEWGCVFKRAKP